MPSSCACWKASPTSRIWRADSVRPEVDRGAHRDRAHVRRLLDAPEQDLVELVRVGEELVVVDLHDERDLVGVLARHRAQHAEGRGDRVAAALDGQLHDVLGVEVGGVLRERGARRVLDALVHGQDRDVAGAGQAAVSRQLLEAAQHRHRAVGDRVHAVHEVGARAGAATSFGMPWHLWSSSARASAPSASSMAAMPPALDLVAVLMRSDPPGRSVEARGQPAQLGRADALLGRVLRGGRRAQRSASRSSAARA